MHILSTIFNDAGEPIATALVSLNDLRITELQILHLRLGLEVSIVSKSGRVDYALPGALHRMSPLAESAPYQVGPVE